LTDVPTDQFRSLCMFVQGCPSLGDVHSVVTAPRDSSIAAAIGFRNPLKHSPKDRIRFSAQGTTETEIYIKFSLQCLTPHLIVSFIVIKPIESFDIFAGGRRAVDGHSAAGEAVHKP